MTKLCCQSTRLLLLCSPSIQHYSTMVQQTPTTQFLRYSRSATYLTIKKIKHGIKDNDVTVDNEYPPAKVALVAELLLFNSTSSKSTYMDAATIAVDATHKIKPMELPSVAMTSTKYLQSSAWIELNGARTIIGASCPPFETRPPTIRIWHCFRRHKSN